MRRVRRTLLALLIAAGSVAGWIAFRDNGLVGGLDHAGPLELAGGPIVGGTCAPAGNQISLDHLRNRSRDSIEISRVEVLVNPRWAISELYSFDGSRQGGGATAAGKYTLIDPRRPAGTLVPPHGDRGVSYVVRPRGARTEIPPATVVRGLTVDYRIGSRKFRESGGTEVRLSCRAARRA